MDTKQEPVIIHGVRCILLRLNKLGIEEYYAT